MELTLHLQYLPGLLFHADSKTRTGWSVSASHTSLSAHLLLYCSLTTAIPLSDFPSLLSFHAHSSSGCCWHPLLHPGWVNWLLTALEDRMCICVVFSYNAVFIFHHIQIKAVLTKSVDVYFKLLKVYNDPACSGVQWCAHSLDRWAGMWPSVVWFSGGFTAVWGSGCLMCSGEYVCTRVWRFKGFWVQLVILPALIRLSAVAAPVISCRRYNTVTLLGKMNG